MNSKMWFFITKHLTYVIYFKNCGSHVNKRKLNPNAWPQASMYKMKEVDYIYSIKPFHIHPHQDSFIKIR